jgi:translocation and assembly module TamA
LRWTVLVALKSGGLFNGEDEVFLSEVERLGGLATIRGFDEESIFAKSYGIFTTEVRYLIDNQTNVHAFVDFAEVRSPFFRNGNHSQPFGVGVGFSLGTGAMRFTLDYAIGSVVGDPFLFRNNRLHIGFTGKF